MSDHTFVIPSEIPFDTLRDRELEECVYWLLDGMGAKDLEWRVGGSGKGAPDGGRDLEATFLIPTPDGEVTKQRWWVEAKGRTGTVEITALQQAVLNAQGRDDLDVLIVVTNTTYSNPTRDWAKQATRNRPRPAVRLWDRPIWSACSLAILRLSSTFFPRALSPQGRLEVIRHKLWNFCAFTDGRTLSELWKQRTVLRWDAASQFSVISSEIANGDLARRPWTTAMTDDDLASCLVHAVANTFYLVKRADDAGVDQYPFLCTIAHLLIATLARFDELKTASLLQYALSDQNDTPYPKDVGKLLLGPVLNRAFLELRDVCSYDCLRVRLLSSDACFDDSQRKAYWKRYRFDQTTHDELEENDMILIIQSQKERCVVGFPVSADSGCPLVEFDNESDYDLLATLATLRQTIRFRTAEASDTAPTG